MHSEVSPVRSCEQAALGAAHPEHANEQLRGQLEAIRHRLRDELDHAALAERRALSRKVQVFCRHRGKTLDSGASSGGILLHGLSPRI